MKRRRCFRARHGSGIPKSILRRIYYSRPQKLRILILPLLSLRHPRRECNNGLRGRNFESVLLNSQPPCVLPESQRVIACVVPSTSVWSHCRCLGKYLAFCHCIPSDCIDWSVVVVYLSRLWLNIYSRSIVTD
jgi:hypothetical protein